MSNVAVQGEPTPFPPAVSHLLQTEYDSRVASVGRDPAAVERLFVDLFLEAHAKAPKQLQLHERRSRSP
jgi:hypothetical protein